MCVIMYLRKSTIINSENGRIAQIYCQKLDSFIRNQSQAQQQFLLCSETPLRFAVCWLLWLFLHRNSQILPTLTVPNHAALLLLVVMSLLRPPWRWTQPNNKPQVRYIIMTHRWTSFCPSLAFSTGFVFGSSHRAYSLCGPISLVLSHNVLPKL